MDIEMRAVTPEEIRAYVTAIRTGLARDATEEDFSRQKPMIEFDRTLAVFDKGEIVGTARVLSVDSLEMTVPGGSLPLAGVSACAVLPTHRRRGIFTRLMERQLRDIHETGEALAALGASESIIYGRFGYGMASFHERWTIERHHTAFAHSPELGGRVGTCSSSRNGQRRSSRSSTSGCAPSVWVWSPRSRWRQLSRRYATRRRRQCSRPQPAPRPPGSASCLPCSPAPARLRGSSVEWDRRTLLWDLFGGGTSGYSRYMHAVYERDGRPDGYVERHHLPHEFWRTAAEGV